MRRRRWIGAAAAGALAPALGGCGARDGRPTLRMWAMGREGEVAVELLEGFRAEHPDVELRIEQLPWSAAHEKLLTAYAGDATPDVAQLGNTWLAEFDAIGAIEPLDDWLAGRLGAGEVPPPPLADHFGGVVATHRIGGRIVALPWTVDTRIAFVRRDLFARAGVAQPPRDWAQWLAALQAVRPELSAGGHPLFLPLNEPEPLIALALQSGATLLRDGGRFGDFRSPAFERAWRFWRSLYDRGLAPRAGDQQIANVWNEFAAGRFACYVSGPWQIGEFRRRLPPALQGAWAAWPLPGPDGPGASIAGGSGLAIFRRSRVKPQARALLAHLARPTVQRRFHALTGNLPPRRASWAGSALADDPPTRAFGEQLERLAALPAVPEWERIAGELRIVAERVVRGELSPQAGLERLDDRTDAILAKRRWMLERRT